MEKVANKLTKVVSRKTNPASRFITFEAANLAKFSDGSCTCSMGDTSVLVTAVSQQPRRHSTPSSFVPLNVDYRQKAAAAGRIPMTHLRRDIGITEKEILTSRMIDRSIRPLFTKGYSIDTQIICNLLAVDGIHNPDVLAINGASASLAISDIPWNGPIGAVRMGLIGENPVANPTRKEQENSRVDLVLATNSSGNVIMIDGCCREPVLMPDILKTIKQATKECQNMIESIRKLQSMIGKSKRDFDSSFVPNENHVKSLESIVQEKLKEILTNYSYDKISRDEAIFALRTNASEAIKETYPDLDPNIFSETFNLVFRRIYWKILNEKKIRCDGRQFTELRPITCDVNLYKPLHGSAIFQRGQTQVFCSTTFDSPDAAYRTDATTLLMSGIKEKNFMLHYEFPPFATNEVGKVGTMPGRREIGHGALAEKGIRPVIPELNDMTLRLNCEVLESNGSSSMASVCAGSLSLMDAGVNIKQHVAGVAMGLFTSSGEDESSSDLASKQEPIILTDILGLEDYIGDMDFKIAGTKKAITALQLDVKPKDGISIQTLHKTIQQAHTARSEIINKMDKVIKEPRKEKKSNHPVIKTIHVPAHKRAKFVGFGGANLKKLVAKIGVRISSYNPDDINENEYNDTLGATARDNFIIFAPNKDAMEEAEEFIKTLLEKEYKEPELEFNGVYTATIQELRPNGVMITLYPNMIPTLLPLSQLDIRTVKHPSALNLEVGQQIQVKYFGRDPATGQMRLSRKSLQMTSVSRVHKSTPLG